MPKKPAVRALAADDDVVGACVVTDKQTGEQTTRCGTKDQCDNWGGVFMGPPCGLGVEAAVGAPEKAAVKTSMKTTAPRKEKMRK